MSSSMVQGREASTDYRAPRAAGFDPRSAHMTDFAKHFESLQGVSPEEVAEIKRNWSAMAAHLPAHVETLEPKETPQMDAGELHQRIQTALDQRSGTPGVAVRAVLELHAPVAWREHLNELAPPGPPCCVHCSTKDVPSVWPCPTVEAMARGLLIEAGLDW